MPGHGLPGFERAAVEIALGGVYNLRVYNLLVHHDDVLQPVLRHLKDLHLTGLGPEGLKARQELGEFLGSPDTQATRFDERRTVILARRAAAKG